MIMTIIFHIMAAADDDGGNGADAGEILVMRLMIMMMMLSIPIYDEYNDDWYMAEVYVWMQTTGARDAF